MSDEPLDILLRNIAGATGTRAGSQPLPPTREDPSVTAGYTEQQAYLTKVQDIRWTAGISDLDKARRLLAAWEQTTARLAELYADFNTRHRARLEYLEAQMPVGPPPIPAGVSAADKAVLQQAWRTALDQARNAGNDQRDRMLTDAERFDDDTMRRAVLTAYNDAGRVDVIDRWADNQGPDAAARMAEWRLVRGLLDGRVFEYAWVAQALKHPPRPPEAANILALERAQAAQEQEMRAQRDANTARRRL